MVRSVLSYTHDRCGLFLDLTRRSHGLGTTGIASGDDRLLAARLVVLCAAESLSQHVIPAPSRRCLPPDICPLAQAIVQSGGAVGDRSGAPPVR